MTPSQTLFIQTAARIAAALAANPNLVNTSNEWRKPKEIAEMACIVAHSIFSASEAFTGSTPSQPSGKGESEGEGGGVVEAAKGEPRS